MELNLPNHLIDLCCQKWHIAELALFGSVLRSDFNPQSDIDFLVTFMPDAHNSLFDLVHMEKELKQMLDREVNLVSRSGIESSRNYLRRNAILNSAKVIYAARS